MERSCVTANPLFFLPQKAKISNWHSLQPRCHPVSASPVTLAECLVLPIRQNDSEKQQIFVEVLTSAEMADFVKTDAVIARRAAEIRVQYSLKLPDALQIATAISSDCEAFLTNDVQLKRVIELQVLVISELSA